jgi:hypothetical protein
MHRPTLAALALSLVLASALRAADPQELLPPTILWHGASEALIAKPDDPWITPAEKLQLLDTPNYDDTIAYLQKLVAAAPTLLSLQPFGHTAQGRTLYVVVATKEKSPTPAALLAGGKPTLLAQAGIHAGEIDGKDAGLMLLRDIALRGKDRLLDHANFLFVPVFNADGHNRPNQRGPVHQGWRTSAQNLNLNRDYVKADTPEMRAMLALLNAWQPALYLDLHVTDGIDCQYDITFGFNGDLGTGTSSPHIAAWLNQHFRPDVDAALTTAGHIPGPLIFAMDDRKIESGLMAPTTPPRFSDGYGDVRHLATVLVENHSLKPYPQRVLGTYILLEAALSTLGVNGADLATATALDRAGRPLNFLTNWSESGGERLYVDFLGIDYQSYDSPATGGKEVRWLGRPKTYRALPLITGKPELKLPRPKAYYVPVTKPEVIERLALHGIQYETLKEAKTLEVEMDRLVNPKASSEPFEGHYLLTTEVKAEVRTETFPAGSVRVATDQPLGDLAMTLLEPACSDSLLACGFFPEILQRTEYIEGYVLAPLADKMLETNPELKAEFAKKLAADPKFAADPTARLEWFYAQTKFYDDRYLLYPVGIER